MNIGMITCNYFMRIYNYNSPESFDWGKMTDKYRSEFEKNDFMKMAQEIRDMGYDYLEIWEPNFSHKVYSTEAAKILSDELKEMGFKGLVYCIGGWEAVDVPQVEVAYRFAKALGAPVVTGCIVKEDAKIIMPEIEKWGKELGIYYAIENHPEPNFEKAEDIAEVIKDYEMIGANLDTGIYNMQGYDVLAAADLLKDKIYHCHFKDTLKGGEGCLPIGDGDAPMADILQKLIEWDYKHMVSVEFEHFQDPAPGLVKSMAFIKDVIC